MQYFKKKFTCHWICNFLLLWHEFLHLSMLLTQHCSSGSSLGASSCHLFAGFSCLGHATEHIRCSLCSVHGIKELLTRRSPTCPFHGHWRAGLRCDTCPWSPWLLARSVWPSDEPDWRDCPQGDRIWADVPPNVHAVSCRGLYKVQWETKDTVFPALLPMGNKSRSQVHGSDVCILWEALSWRPGGSEKKLGHSTMPWSQNERCIESRTLHELVFSFHLCFCQFPSSFGINVMCYVYWYLSKLQSTMVSMLKDVRCWHLQCSGNRTSSSILFMPDIYFDTFKYSDILLHSTTNMLR